MSTNMVILWSRSELVGTSKEQDTRVPGIREDGVRRLKALGVEVFGTSDSREALDQIPNADIFYGRQITPEMLSAARKLKWIHTPIAGMDGFWFPELRKSDTPITNARGIYSDVIADHVYALLLCFARGLHAYVRQQSQAKWESGIVPVVHLESATVGIVGLGGIGLAVADRAHTSGLRVVGVDPAPKGKPAFIDRIWPPEALHQMLGESDFVAICAPHTGETEHMFDAAAFEAMKNTAVLINVSRGKVVDTEALTSALREGQIAGAGLDVLEEEPLPSQHPLWKMDQVVITPHVAGRSAYPYQETRRMDLLVENARRLLQGETLLNVVDKEKGYVVQAG